MLVVRVVIFPQRGNLGDLWRGDFLSFFSVFLGMPELEQIRTGVKLISDREYPLLNVSILYIWIKISVKKILGLHRSTGNCLKPTAELPKKQKRECFGNKNSCTGDGLNCRNQL